MYPAVADLLCDPHFLAADLILYHFAIYNPLIDALLVGNGHARQAVCFHNITPLKFVGMKQRALISKSFRQLHNLRCADRLWPVSQVNADVLRENGMDPDRITVIPLSVERPARANLADKASSPIELLFVGRIVSAKGVLDLLEVADHLLRSGAPSFRLRLVGNLGFSDAAYMAEVKQSIIGRGLGSVVEFVGTIDDATLQQLYHRSHILVIPSAHEGFCKPVIEALRAGCVPVGYATHNLKYIAGGLGRMVPFGDIMALTRAVSAVIQGLSDARRSPDMHCLPLDVGQISARQFQSSVDSYVEGFRSERVAAQLVTAVQALLNLSAPTVFGSHATPAGRCDRSL